MTSHENPDLRRLKRLYATGGVATAAYVPFYVLYLSQRGLSPSQVGLILSCAALLAVAFGPMWGHAADVRLGLRRALALTLGTSAVLMVLVVAPWPPVVLGVIMIGFLSVFSTNVTLEDSLTLSVLGPGRAVEYGSVRLWTSLGWAISVLVCGAFYQWHGLQLMAPLAAVGILAMLLTLRGFDRETHGTPDATHRIRDVAAAIRSSRSLGLWLGALTLISIASQGALAFVPLAIVDAGGGPWLLALSASIGAIIEIPIFAQSGRIASVLGLRSAFALGVLCQVVVVGSWVVITSAWGIALTKTITGISFALAYSATVVITSKLVPKAMRAAGQGLQSMTGALGPVIGAALGGIVFEALGSQALFLGAATMMFAGAALGFSALRDPGFASPKRAMAA